MSDVATWNNEFNSAANSCGLDCADLLDLDESTIIADCHWSRVGDRISVCIGRAIWTVMAADLSPNA